MLAGCSHDLLARWAGRLDAITASAVAEYIRHFNKPSIIEATCEDYRAGASVDLEHDLADRNADRRVQCPMLVIWGKEGARWASPVAT